MRHPSIASIPIRLGLITLSFGVLLSLLLAWRVDVANGRRLHVAVAEFTEGVTRDVVERLHLYQYGLRGARGHILAVGDRGTTRAGFLSYTQSRDIDREFPGARGFGFVRRVARAEEAEFLASARADGRPDFKLNELAPHAGEHYVIQYVEPLERNAAALGLDIASEASRRAAAEAAMRTGEARLSAPITLVQASGKPEQAFVILLPVYRTGATPPTESDRVAQAFGWSYAALVMEEVLADLHLDATEAKLELRDITGPQPSVHFFASAAPPDATAVYSHSLDREVFGRRWQIQLSVYPTFVRQMNLPRPLVLLALGFGFSLLTGALVAALSLNHQRRKQTAADQARLAAIVANSVDGIIGKTLEGVVTSWNDAAERIFGFSAQEAIGHTLAELIVPETLQDEETQILKQLSEGKVVEPFETIRRCSDGREIPVSVAISPIRDFAGKVVGASKTVRDISGQKAAAAEIMSLNRSLKAQIAERTSELDEAHRSLTKILDGVPMLIGYWDRNLINRLANHCYEEWMGVNAAAMPGIHLRDLVGEEQFRAMLPAVQEAMAGKYQHFERVLPPIAGNGERHIIVHYLPDVQAGEVCGMYVIAHDVTEVNLARLRLAEVLRENQALLSTLHTQTFYSVTDVRGNIIDVNDNFCRATGYAREELLGQNHRLLRADVHTREFWRNLWLTVASGQSWRGDVCIRTKAGGLRWFDTVIAPFFDADGRIERYVALRADITERKIVQAKHDQVTQLLGNVLSAASEVAIVATDLAGVITIFNTGAERMLGYAAADLVGQATPLVFHVAEEVEERGRELSRLFSERITGFRVLTHLPELQGSEIRHWTYVRRDGTRVLVSLAATAMRDSEGVVQGYLGVAMDITEELRNKERLTELTTQLSIATEVAQLGVWTWIPSENLMHWNDRMFELYELPLSLRDQGPAFEHWYARLHPEDAEAAAERVRAAVEGKATFDQVFRLLLPSGKIRYIQAGALVEWSVDGKVGRVTGINIDITSQREHEALIQQEKDRAFAANQAKSAFLANMSHEIRTPMNAVLGMLQLVGQTDLNLRQRDYVAKAHSAAKSLLGLLNDILDFSKIDSGKLELDLHPFDMETLLRDLAAVLSGTHKEKEIELLFDVDAQLPGALVGDSLRLKQILINLAGNALKFTPRGHVVVAVKLLAEEADGVLIRISVTDTGIGIAADQIERIFDGFVQAEASTSRRFGGTGLGLAICRRLVNLMGGELRVESQLGVGSRFWFVIKCRRATAARLIEPGEVPGQLRVLVVDDNPSAAEILARAVSALGWQAEVAVNGYVALEMVRAETDAFDLVFMDWRMPELDGLATAEKLRDATGGRVPIIMVTAFGREALADPMRRQSPVFQDLLTKPVTPHQLFESAARVLHLEQRVAPESQAIGRVGQPADELPLAGMHLLVVEDNALNRQVADELLRSAGARVDLAEGGVEALAKVATTTYDAVLMDVQMPDMDGLEATRRIRADGRWRSLPILAMTANAAVSDREACLAAGMDGHLSKPIDMEQLVPALIALTAAPSGGDASAIPQAEAGESMVEDLADVLKRFGGNKSLLHRMAGNFEPEARRLLDDLERHRERGSAPDATLALHSLKGVAATLGACGLAQRAAELESRVKDAESPVLEVLLPAAALTQLRELTERSAIELEAQVASLLEPAAASPGRPPEQAELVRALQPVRGLLEAGNLQVIEVVDALAARFPANRAVATLADQVNNLDFQGATATLELLLRETAA